MLFRSTPGGAPVEVGTVGTDVTVGDGALGINVDVPEPPGCEGVDCDIGVADVTVAFGAAGAGIPPVTCCDCLTSAAVAI